MPKTRLRTKQKQRIRDELSQFYYTFQLQRGGRRNSFKKVLIHRRIWRKVKRTNGEIDSIGD